MNQYIDVFSAVLSKGLNLVLRWSEKFPGSVLVTPFREYIQYGHDSYLGNDKDALMGNHGGMSGS